MTRTRRASGLRLAAWVLTLVGVVVVLWVSGRGSLRLPPLGDAPAWRRWLAEGDATTVAFAVVRMLALGAAGYCLVVTVVGGAARLVRAGAVVALVDRVTVPPLRRLLSVTMSAGLATGLAGAGVAAAEAPTTATSVPVVTVTMHRLPPAAAPGTPPPSTVPTTTGPTTTGPATTTTTMPSAPSTTTTTTVAPAPAASPAPDAVASSSAAPPSPADRWTVRPGDCFWSIAADVLARAWGRPAVDAEIAPYWRRLVEANRAALADGSNPDLVFPGQVFTLPPP